jgi:GTPase
MNKPIVAIIGRPNVGKSTLFNRIIRRREAIVDDKPGVTRDRFYQDADWSGVSFSLMDTGGYLPDTNDLIHEAVLNQVKQAIHEADVILFIVDAKAGLTALDEEISGILKESGRPIVLAVNKVDNESDDLAIHDFYKLAVENPIKIASSNGRNIGDLLDKIISLFPKNDANVEHEAEEAIKLAVVGRPNVGKSSFINAVLGVERHIVTNIPGTTRDAIDSKFKREGQDYILIDTAGLRKKSKIKDEIEYYSNTRSIRAIEQCDVVIIIIDATESLQDQDKTIIEHAVQYKKGILLAINKWDLIPKNSLTTQEFELKIQERMPYINYVPTIFISALTKQRVFKVIDIAKSVYQERCRYIKTNTLNAFLERITASQPPQSTEGKFIKVKYATQVKTKPPVFAFFCNYPKLIKPNYRHFLENKLREQFGFLGVPLTLTFREK